MFKQARVAALLGALAEPASGQSARPAVEAQYERLAVAIRKSDLSGILQLQASTFTSHNPTGSSFDYAAMADDTRRMTAAIDSVIHIRNAIRSFRERGDTVVADVCQEFSRMQRIDGRQRRVDTSVLQEETWVRTPGSWKRWRVENVRGMRWFVDGVRVDPMQPAIGGPEYVPEVDPPTGCGLK